MKRSDFIYLAITNDKYELPIAVFDNLKQIAKYAEIPYENVWYMISRKILNRELNCYFIKVFVGDCE